MKYNWYKVHLNDFDVKSYGCELSASENRAEISVTQSFGWSIQQPFCRLKAIYVIDGSGLDIKCEAEFSNKIDMLPRFGISFSCQKIFQGRNISDMVLQKATLTSVRLAMWADLRLISGICTRII